jgi:hypothetical protein
MSVVLPAFTGRGLRRLGGFEIDIGIAQPSVQNQNRARDLRQRIGPVGGDVKRQCTLVADRNAQVGNLLHRSMIRRDFVRGPGAGTCHCKNHQHGSRGQTQ